jgi:methylenetetrahydrofolate dehydrogenase (NADP+)/methenyltetrahydrofolate cyclohydrolase
MARILQGKEVRDALALALRQKVSKLEEKPTLAIFQVGDRADSTAYIKQKKTFGENIGARVIHRHYPESVTQAELLKDIGNDNEDGNIHGIIIQMPLPEHLHKEELIEAVYPKKDVDGLTATNTKRLYDNKPGLVPATARGILMLLDHYNISVEGKRVTIIGRSNLVGKPTALALLNRNATILIAHSKTPDLKTVCKRADILIAALGKPEFITKDFVSAGQVIIDVGINSVAGEKFDEEIPTKRKIVGDVNFKEVEPIVAAISPVPGGVGPMTVASLFENLLEAYQKKG